MMLVDGKIDDKEMEYLRSLAKKYEIPNKKIEEIINEFSNVESPVDYAFETTGASNPVNILKALIRMALSDGIVEAEENNLLKEFARKNNISPEEYNQIVKELKSKLK